MSYARYLLFDIVGGAFWVAATILGGYSLGHFIPNIGHYIHYVIAVVIILSVVPPIIGLLRSKRASRNSSDTVLFNRTAK
jgi:membrane-associated protein